VIGRCCAGGKSGGHASLGACRLPLAPLSRRQRAASVVRGWGLESAMHGDGVREGWRLTGVAE